MGINAERFRFFGRVGISLPVQHGRPKGASIPDGHAAMFYIFSAIKAGVGITYHDVKNGRVGWEDIWRILDAESLFSWLDWENHAIAESRRKTK